MTALYYPTKWLSNIIMKITPTVVQIKFRNLEKINLKYSASKAHCQFNIYIYRKLRTQTAAASILEISLFNPTFKIHKEPSSGTEIV